MCTVPSKLHSYIHLCGCSPRRMPQLTAADAASLPVTKQQKRHLVNHTQMPGNHTPAYILYSSDTGKFQLDIVLVECTELELSRGPARVSVTRRCTTFLPKEGCLSALLLTSANPARIPVSGSCQLMQRAPFACRHMPVICNTTTAGTPMLPAKDKHTPMFSRFLAVPFTWCPFCV